MDISIIAEASSILQRYFVGWGISILIDNNLLFDTFSNYRVLKKNMEKQKVNVADLKYVVISHEHWDHTNGLWYVLDCNPRVKVFICPGFSDEFKKKLGQYKVEVIAAQKTTRIKEGVYTTGEMSGKYNNSPLSEQSLVIKKDKISIITGCSHPGIINIVKRVKEEFALPIELVLGGLHLMDKAEKQIQEVVEQLKSLEVEKVAPCHCTGSKARKALFSEYKNNCLNVRAGMKYSI